jgi:ATP synthase protein I
MVRSDSTTTRLMWSREGALHKMGEDPPPDQLAQLAKRIDEANKRRGRPTPEPTGASRAAMGIAMRMAIELAAGLCVGLALGWVFDRVLGTRPWGLIVFFFLGVAAGMLNVFRAAKGIGYKGINYSVGDKPNRDKVI